MQSLNTILIPPTRIGSIPVVAVGHQFFLLCEMITIGIHNHWFCEIDYTGVGKKKDYPQYKLPITLGIVLSGKYENDLDKYEDIVYTGQGGCNFIGDIIQISDQVMERRNLGLKVSIYVFIINYLCLCIIFVSPLKFYTHCKTLCILTTLFYHTQRRYTKMGHELFLILYV